MLVTRDDSNNLLNRNLAIPSASYGNSGMALGVGNPQNALGLGGIAGFAGSSSSSSSSSSAHVSSGASVASDSHSNSARFGGTHAGGSSLFGGASGLTGSKEKVVPVAEQTKASSSTTTGGGGGGANANATANSNIGQSL